MNKYSKDLAEMLGSDVEEVLSAWMNDELQKFKAKNNNPTKPRDCSNDWFTYTVSDQTIPQTTETNISHNYTNIFEQLSAELSEIRTALDAVTLDRNQYKRVKELAECKLWDEQDKKDDLQAQVQELKTANIELTKKIQHLTVQNESLNKLLNYSSDNTADVSQIPKTEERYIIFPRTNLSKCFKANSIDAVIYHVTNEKSINTYAFTYDRIKSQFENADVAMFNDYYIVKL